MIDLPEYGEVLMKLILSILFCLMAAVLSLNALLCASLLDNQSTVQPDLREGYSKSERYIPMRDGKRLFTVIYEPQNTSEKYPILLTRTPYNARPYGEGFPPSLGPSPLFAKEGYIFVYQDVRGTFMSEGEFEDVRP